MTPTSDPGQRVEAHEDKSAGQTEDRLEANKTLVRQVVEAVVNGRNLTRTQGDFGINDAVGRIRWLLTALPDAHVTIDWQLAEGESVATGATCRGTHLGEWEGLPPSGKPVTLRLFLRDQVVDGQIVHDEAFFDLLAALEQVGAQLSLRHPI
jgi:predicted ester cyclase